jgi:four helix bundle protein
VANELENRLLAWVRDLVDHVKTFPRDMVSRVIAHQLLRSGTSVGANYAEAQGASSRRDFANYVRHSLKSARESVYWLRLADSVLPTVDLANSRRLRGELDQLTAILFSIARKTGSA